MSRLLGVVSGIAKALGSWKKFDIKEAPTSGLIFVAPSYDGLTTIMSRWLIELADASERPSLILTGVDVTPSRFDAALTNYPEGGALIIFFGHGRRECLLTAPNIGYEIDALKDHSSVLCTAREIEKFLPVRVAAYCCESAAELGREVRGSHRLSGFLGFQGKPWFYLGTHQREACFRNPFTTVLREVIAVGSILSTGDLQRLRELYEEQYRKWCDITEEEDPMNLLVGACLLSHLRALDDEV